jgi:uncharacterized protein
MKLKVLLSVAFAILLSMTVIVFDATHGALTRLKINRLTLVSDQIPEAFDELSLVYFSDMHFFTLNKTYYEKVISRINTLNPDFVVFGGDLIDETHYDAYSETDRTSIIDLLKSIKAPYGKFALLSDTDLEHQTELTSLYLQAGFEIINNKVLPIHMLGSASINFVGWNETSDVSILGQLASDEYTLAFGYDPDLSSILNEHEVDVMFAGKTHGGQVTLPILGPLFMKSETYQKGVYPLSKLNLYVSTGIGVSNLKARWLTDPSLMLITFKNK